MASLTIKKFNLAVFIILLASFNLTAGEAYEKICKIFNTYYRTPLKVETVLIQLQNCQNKKDAMRLYKIINAKNLKKLISGKKTEWKTSEIAKTFDTVRKQNPDSHSMGSAIITFYSDGKKNRISQQEMCGFFHMQPEEDLEIYLINDQYIYFLKNSKTPIKIQGSYKNKLTPASCLLIIKDVLSPKNNPKIKETNLNDNTNLVIDEGNGFYLSVLYNRQQQTIAEYHKINTVSSQRSGKEFEIDTKAEFITFTEFVGLKMPLSAKSIVAITDKSNNQTSYTVSFEIYKYSTEVSDSVFDFNIKDYPGRKVIYEK